MIVADGIIVGVEQSEGGYTFDLFIFEEGREEARVNIRPEEWAALDGAVRLFMAEYYEQ